MIELDIVERLRGKVRVPVNDGAGLLDGKDFFERTFPTSKAAMEAANEIERLRTALKALDVLLDFSDEDVGKIWTFEDTTDIQAAFRLAHAALTLPSG